MPREKKSEKETNITNPNPKTDRLYKSNRKKAEFPVICIGASAGGLEALKAFFSKVSPNSGMGYVVVVHMSPNQPSMMPDLLQNVTSIPVEAAKDGQTIEPNHVYVIAPNKEITVFKKTIQVLDAPRKSIAHPIDSFLKSLGMDMGSNCAAIILSGTGTDGTLGLKEVKANDGLVLVQSENTAAYDGMLKSAIKTGLVDMVLPPEEMPDKLLEYFSHHQNKFVETFDKKIFDSAGQQEKWLKKIFAILRTQIGHDFSTYKVNTIIRRINRRMVLNHIENHEIYVRFLRENPKEVESLFRELLIGVTNFFRDPESFEVLKRDVLPELFEQVSSGATFRVWVPGCSTGEEVYSLAIVLRESIINCSNQINIQLFGTDIDKFAIDKARDGIFPASIASEVSEERLKRFFIKEGDYFRISKELRECAIFSVQDIIKDPPFSRLNMLCCRNLLIYLNSETQKRLMPLFHYTLNPNGILVLGSSETIGGFSRLFKTVDKKWKIFRRQEVPSALRQIFDYPSGVVSKEDNDTFLLQPLTQQVNLGQLTQKAVLDQFAPAAILIDGKGEILHVQGRTGKYIEIPSGNPTNNIIAMVREGLRIELSSALRIAKSSGEKVTRKRLAVKTNGDVQIIDLHVCPQKTLKELSGYFLVVFEDKDNSSTPFDSKQDLLEISSIDSSKISELERELQITRESHQTTIEELESSNEELKSTNEELQSSNEELQSTNEELESSKEELQSLNEEMQTVNSELQSKLEELSAAQDDMHNLLNSTEIATIFVDNALCIRRYTNEAMVIINLIQTDIGRPLKHVVSNLQYDKMLSDCEDVLKSLIPKKAEVQTVNGDWYSMRILPYRTIDNRIDGVVLTFTSIEDQKKANVILNNAVCLIQSIFDIHDEPMAVVDQDCNIVISNTALSLVIGKLQQDITGMNIFDAVGIDAKEIDADKSELRSKFEAALNNSEDFTINNFVIGKDQCKQTYTIKARNIINVVQTFPYRILLKFIVQQ